LGARSGTPGPILVELVRWFNERFRQPQGAAADPRLDNPYFQGWADAARTLLHPLGVAINPLMVVLSFIMLTRADGQRIAVNPRHITAITPARDHGHFTSDVHCVIHTDDRKFFTVIESCETVYKYIQGKKL
jgi:hypothetical protein